jgi:hypothetical protein
MKKQIALVLTLAALLMSACDDENPVGPGPTPTPLSQAYAKPEPVIYSIYPNAGAPGTTLAILGTNFSPALSNNYVMFGSTSAEITYVGYGVISIRVPNLPEGDYEINVTTDGQARRAAQMFTITNSQH